MAINWKILFWSSLPISVIVAFGFILMMLGLWIRNKRGRRVLLILSLLGIASSFATSMYLWGVGLYATVSMLTVDPFAFFLYQILLIIGFFTCLSHYEYLEKQDVDYPETYALTLFAISGMMMMVSTTHLLLFFLGLEVMSLAVYVLVGLKRRDLRSNEAAMKYFILGALTAGLLIYGIALIYGTTGVMDLKSISFILVQGANRSLLQIGLLLVLVGFAFKMAAVPFHFWTPDVYEGAPISVTGFMATAVKAAAFGALLRTLMILVKFGDLPLTEILSFFSIATMVVGNLVALYQRNIKRMLAYSSIAHAGYILVGVTAAFARGGFHKEALGACTFYLLAYGVMTLGAFAVASAVAGEKGDRADLEEYSGLALRSPKLAAVMALFMVGLTGIPPTVGFAGKFYLFEEAIHQRLYSLVIVGVLMSAISAYYYLGVVVAMYFRKKREIESIPLSLPTAHVALILVILFCTVSTLYFGLAPSRYVEMAAHSGFTPFQERAALLP